MHDNQEELFKLVRNGDFSMTSSGWPQISPPAKDLVSRMLTVEPARRITAEQVMSHPWITLDAALVPNNKLAAAHKEIKRLQARRRFKKAIAAVRLTVRMKLGMAASAMRRARAAGVSAAEAEAAFYAGARAGAEVRGVIERRLALGQEFPDALVAGGRRVTTHQFRVSELAPPLSADAIARARMYS